MGDVGAKFCSLFFAAQSEDLKDFKVWVVKEIDMSVDVNEMKEVKISL